MTTRRSLFRTIFRALAGAAVVRKAPKWWGEYVAEDAVLIKRFPAPIPFWPPEPTISLEAQAYALNALNKIIGTWNTPESFRRTIQVVDPDGTRREVVINAISSQVQASQPEQG